MASSDNTSSSSSSTTTSSTCSSCITLESSDGEKFVISKSEAVLSVTIEENWEDNVILVINIDSKTLAKVITYLKVHAADQDSSNPFKDEEKKKLFDKEYFSSKEIAEGLNMSVLSAAYYLQINGLRDLVHQKNADERAIIVEKYAKFNSRLKTKHYSTYYNSEIQPYYFGFDTRHNPYRI